MWWVGLFVPGWWVQALNRLPAPHFGLVLLSGNLREGMGVFLVFEGIPVFCCFF